MGCSALVIAMANHNNFENLGVHCISPRLPGWAHSSPWPEGKPIKEWYGVFDLYIGRSKRLQSIYVWWLLWVRICTDSSWKFGMCLRYDILRGIFVVSFEPELYQRKELDELDWRLPLACYFPAVTKMISNIDKKRRTITEIWPSVWPGVGTMITRSSFDTKCKRSNSNIFEF